MGYMKQYLMAGAITLAIATGTLIALQKPTEAPKIPQKATQSATKSLPYTSILPSSQKVVAAVNKLRADIGVPPLTEIPELDQSAMQKCQDMAANQYYSHVNPITGKHGYEYAQAALPNATGVGENLEEGRFLDDSDPVHAWLTSPTHKAAMLSPQHTRTGVASCSTGNKHNDVLVVEHFAN